MTREHQRQGLVVGVGLIGMLVALRVRPETLFDDAAITFRYAERIADGLGFTYNDGDRTGGASAPLYTLALAAAATLGVRPDVAAAALSVPLFGAAVSLATALAWRLGGLVAALTTAVVLLTGNVFQNLMLSGMESATAVVIGLCALLALSRGHTIVAAALGGLAVVNRLDATFLALALLAAVAATDRRVPWKEGATAAAVAAPWFLFATWYFGSPVPFSATQKLMDRSGTWSFDPTWFVRTITGQHGALVLLLAVASLPLALRGLRARRWPAAAHLAVLGSLVGHVAAYSLLDFGAPYPWYATFAIPLAVIAASATVSFLAGAAARSGIASVAGALAALVGVALLASIGPGALETAAAILDPPPERTTRLLDATRAEAGEWIDRNADPGDVVRTCFGWVAYEAPRQSIEETCPLNTRRPVGSATWIVDSPEPGTSPTPTVGFAVVAEFRTTGPHGTVVTSTVERRS